MNRAKTILFFLILIIHNLVYGQSQSTSSEKDKIQLSDWKSLQKDEFTIKYPSNWDLDESGRMGTSFYLFSQLSDKDDIFRENINLVIQDLKGYGLTLDEYVEISEKQIKSLFYNVQVSLNDRITKGTTEYQKVIYSGEKGTLHLKFEQCYWVIGDKAFVLTLTCEKNEFDNYQSIGESIFDTFEIK
jgi:hypothetical protein